jgi:glycerol kinase
LSASATDFDDDCGWLVSIERGVVFVPALSGLACPYWDRSAAGLWLGMSTDTSREDLCQAAVEGIALRTSEVIAAIQTRLPPAAKLSVDRGLPRSPYFSQFRADASGHHIENCESAPNFDPGSVN